MKRRTYLTAVTATGIAITGCMGDAPDIEPDTDDEDEDEDEADSDGQDGGEGADGDMPGLAGTFDDLEDLDEWEPFVGSFEADTDTYYTGSQSARLTPNGDGHVRFRRELDDHIDIRDVVPGIALSRNFSGTVLIQLQDQNGDYLEYSQFVESDMPFVRTNFGPTRQRGDPNLDAIVILQVISWFDEEADGELWVDDFHFVPKPNPGRVMLQFHGGFESHNDLALPLLEEYGQQATAFVPTGRVGRDDERMTAEQIGELAEADWTIGSYSARGQQLTDVSSEDLEDDIVDPIGWLEREGYEDGARFFAYPISRHNGEAYELVQDNYELAFAGRAPAQGYATNPHLCSQVANPGPAEVGELLDWTAERGGITSIAFQRLDDEASREALAETVTQLDERTSEGELELITPQEMLDEYVY